MHGRNRSSCEAFRVSTCFPEQHLARALHVYCIANESCVLVSAGHYLLATLALGCTRQLLPACLSCKLQSKPPNIQHTSDIS